MVDYYKGQEEDTISIILTNGEIIEHSAIGIAYVMVANNGLYYVQLYDKKSGAVYALYNWNTISGIEFIKGDTDDLQ